MIYRLFNVWAWEQLSFEDSVTAQIVSTIDLNQKCNGTEKETLKLWDSRREKWNGYNAIGYQLVPVSTVGPTTVSVKL